MPAVKSIDELRPGTFEYLQRMLRTGKDLSDEALVRALRANAGQPIPPDVLDYLCRRLEGTIKRKRGRKPGDARYQLRDELIVLKYEQYSTWLEKRQQRLGLTGWKGIRRADWWQGPPHMRAAYMVLRYLRPLRLPACDVRHVINLSSRKNPKLK